MKGLSAVMATMLSKGQSDNIMSRKTGIIENLGDSNVTQYSDQLQLDKTDWCMPISDYVASIVIGSTQSVTYNIDYCDASQMGSNPTYFLHWDTIFVQWISLCVSSLKLVCSTPKGICTWYGLHYILLWFVSIRFYPYPSGFLYWHWGNHKIAPVPVK